MNQIPNREEESKEAFLHLLHQVVQHTPLKLEETAGTDYDRGYIFYQDMVLRDVEELETTMWDWHHQQLQKAREEGERAVWERIKRESNRDETGMYMFYLADQSELDQDEKSWEELSKTLPTEKSVMDEIKALTKLEQLR